MISIQQVEGKFITDYKVFARKPADPSLVDLALASHRKHFGDNPVEFSADKGFYESMEKLEALEADIEVVSIAKKGSRTTEETLREHSESFRSAQKFRAGVEGSISFLKRCLGLWRCMNKGWEHFVATVGATVFTHNLLVFKLRLRLRFLDRNVVERRSEALGSQSGFGSSSSHRTKNASRTLLPNSN